MPETTAYRPTGAQAIQQCLYGYDDGHRLLATSTKLPPEVERRLLVAGDFPVRERGSLPWGDLTGFPMRELGAYVFSSTWAAVEMPRPGCVWTHTVLIPFGILARIEHLGTMLAYFRRPKRTSSFDGYHHPLPLPGLAKESNATVSTVQPEGLLAALYFEPLQPVVALSGDSDLEDVVGLLLAVWSQQWPKLRRSFSFCTRSTMHRLKSDRMFDVRVSIAMQPRLLESKLSRLGGLVVVGIDDEIGDGLLLKDGVSGQSWLKLAARDIARPSYRRFRLFLRRYGSDVSGGREAFAGLATVYGLLAQLSAPCAIHVGEALVRWFPNPSEAVRLKTDLLSRQPVFGYRRSVDEVSYLRWLYDLHATTAGVLDCFEPEVWRTAMAVRLQQVQRADLWKLAQLALHDGQTRWTNLLLDRLAPNASPEEARAAADGDWPLYLEAARLNPRLLYDKTAWTDSKARTALLAFAVEGEIEPDRLFGAVSFMDDASLVRLLFSRFEADAVRWAADGLAHRGTLPASWTSAALQRPALLLQGLYSASSAHRLAILGILDHLGIRSDAIRSLGPEWWADLVARSHGTLGSSDRLRFLAFCLAIAVDKPGTGSEWLLELSFEDLHRAAEVGIEGSTWQVIDPHIPGFWEYWSWDKCERLKVSVCRAYLTGYLKESRFLLLTTRRKVLRSLLRTMVYQAGGLSLLRRLAHAELSNSERPGLRDELLAVVPPRP